MSTTRATTATVATVANDKFFLSVLSLPFVSGSASCGCRCRDVCFLYFIFINSYRWQCLSTIEPKQFVVCAGGSG